VTILASGAITKASGTGTTTVAQSVFPVMGDILFVTTHIASATVHIASMTSPNVTTWTHVGGAVSGTHSVDLWFGVVTDPNAGGTVTMTGSAAITATVNTYTCQVFTAGGQGTTWSVDGSLATLSNGASTTITYPTLVPAAGGEMYVGYGIATGTPALTTGATSGYTVAVDGANNAVMYNPGVSGSQSPTTLQTSSAASFSLGALIVATPPAGGSIQQVGFPIKNNSGTAIATLAVSPVTVGNLVVVTGMVHSATIHYTTLSGGGVTTWTHLVGPFVGTSGVNSQDMWMGVVTATGSSTITAASSAALTGLTTGITAQEFTVNNPAVTWALDTTGTISNATSTTVTFPSLTPAKSGELYMGSCGSVAGVTSNTQTAKYTSITTALNFGIQETLYNPQLLTGAQSPTMTQASGLSWAVAVLISATLPASGSHIRMISQAVNRASSF
jgi:hypothetical protein